MIKNTLKVFCQNNRIKIAHRWNPIYLNNRGTTPIWLARNIHSTNLLAVNSPSKKPYTQSDDKTLNPKKDEQVKVDMSEKQTTDANNTTETTEKTDTPPAESTVESDESIDPDQEHLTTVFEDMEPYLDTYNVYKELTKTGFTEAQADSIIELLIVQLNHKLSKLLTKYSQKYELENESYLFESAQEELRVDFTRSREQHINELINLINVLERDFNVISDELNNDFIQMKNDNQVSINDQKSENTLQSKQIQLKIQETNHKITTELNSAMRSEIESLRWHLSRWGLISILVCVFSGCTVFYIHRVRATEKKTKNEFVPLVIYEPSEFDEDDYHTDLDRNLV